MNKLLQYTAGALAGIAFTASAEVVFQCGFRNPEDLKSFSAWQVEPEIRQDGVVLSVPQRVNNASLTLKLNPADIAGQRLNFSVEARGTGIAPAREPWNGGKFQSNIEAPGHHSWPSAKIKLGNFDWETLAFSADIPADVTNAQLTLGFQDSYGKLEFRNLKIETAATLLDLRRAANMGFADPVAGDGKGGWSDQGPDNDARNFKWRSPATFANVPFAVIDPAKNNGRSVLTMRAANFPAGLEEAEIPAPAGTVGNHLYLLHTLCYNVPGAVGSVEVTGNSGKRQTFEVQSGRDIGDWWNPKPLANAFPGVLWPNNSGGRVGLYVSHFELDPELKGVKSLRFRSANRSMIWIIAAATVSGHRYDPPSTERVVTRADGRWQELARPARPGIVPGSALDRSFLSQENAPQDRIIVNADGLFARESAPETPVRFLTAAEAHDTIFKECATKEKTREYVRQLKLHGYNMTRLHYFDEMLMRDAKEPLQFNAEVLDRFDYYVHCLKQEGIYLNMDVMSSPVGYTPGYAWAPDPQGRSFNFDLYFDEGVRRNWAEGAKKLFTHVNPYTGKSLVDDPVLAVLTCYNEQEFAFFRNYRNWPKMAPAWRKFLQKKYGTVEQLRASWGEKLPAGVTGWDQVPLFKAEEIRDSGNRGIDTARFLTSLEQNLYRWYAAELKKIGYSGILANYDMGQEQRYHLVRQEMPAVFMHSYHAHPSAFISEGSAMPQTSSIANAGGVIRGLNSMRQYRKPLLITEHGHVFWNNYRYEQAFVTGAYAAFQNVSGLTCHAKPVSVTPAKLYQIRPFSLMFDPVIGASEFLTAFLLRRGDVRPADGRVRITLDPEELYRARTFNDGMNSAHSRLTLLTGVATEVLKPGAQPLPPETDEVVLKTSGGTAVVNNLAGFSQVVDQPGNPFDLNTFVAELKKQKLLPENNRSNPNDEVFESSTGELLMDCRRNYMSVDTPRLQGICAEAGSKAQLSDLGVDELTTRGNLAVVSVDGDRPLRQAKRLVAVYATNALNSGMEFDEKERVTLRKIGQGPTLVETGRFRLRLRHDRADRFKCFALGIDGTRRAELPVTAKDGELMLDIDTARLPGGPALYFELAEK